MAHVEADSEVELSTLTYGLRSMGEARVVVRILNAAAKGREPEDIAAALDRRDIGSPGGHQWRGQTVRRILEHPILHTLVLGHTSNGNGAG